MCMHVGFSLIKATTIHKSKIIFEFCDGIQR